MSKPVIHRPPNSELARWQAILDGESDAFAELRRDACIALLVRSDFDAGGGQLLLWKVGDKGIAVAVADYAGFPVRGADVLFVAVDAALSEVLAQPAGGALSRMRELVRWGEILFFSLKVKSDLLDLGYENFLESLGLAHVGACR